MSFFLESTNLQRHTYFFDRHGELDVIVAFWRLTMTSDIEPYLIQRAIGDVIGVNARACPPASPAAG